MQVSYAKISIFGDNFRLKLTKSIGGKHYLDIVSVSNYERGFLSSLF